MGLVEAKMPDGWEWLDDMPENGFFVGLLEYNGVIWCNTFEARQNSIYRYSDEDDKWHYEHDDHDFLALIGIRKAPGDARPHSGVSEGLLESRVVPEKEREADGGD